TVTLACAGFFGGATVLSRPGAGGAQPPTLHASLRNAAADIHLLRGELSGGTPATTTAVLGDIPAESVGRLLPTATALLRRASQAPLDPVLRQRLERVVAHLDAIHVQLQPRADRDGRSRP